jgi:hypothetical protein
LEADVSCGRVVPRALIDVGFDETHRTRAKISKTVLGRFIYEMIIELINVFSISNEPDSICKLMTNEDSGGVRLDGSFFESSYRKTWRIKINHFSESYNLLLRDIYKRL